MVGELYRYVVAKLEESGAYRANPCDLGAAAILRPFGRALRHFASECACCSGARVLAVAVFSAAFPIVVPAIILALYVCLVAKEIIKPTAEFQEPYNAYDEFHKNADL